jgi:class 3 adenylate cyclase
MVKRDKLFIISLIFVFLFILSVNNIFGELIISQPKSFYNLGDDISINIKLDSFEEDYLDVNLLCDGGFENVYHNVPDSKDFNINRKFTRSFIGNLSGVCFFKFEYGKQVKESQKFELSSVIDLTVNVENVSYDVGSGVKIKGTAIKKNGKLLGQDYPAFVEAYINVENNSVTASEVVKDGQYSLNLSIPETTPAGSYSLVIKVYDKDTEGNLLSSGERISSIIIRQKPSRIEMAIDKTSIDAGENITINPILYDKAGRLMTGQILISAKDSNDDVLFEGFIDLNNNFVIPTKTSTAYGYAKVIAQRENIVNEKQFEIKQLKKLSAEVMNRTLILTNIGNIPYEGVIEIKIGEETILKQINLGVGEKEELFLSAPNGLYDVNIKDENPIFSGTGIPITGGAIGVSEINDGLDKILSNYPILWVFLLLLIIFALYATYKKRKRKEIRFLENAQRIHSTQTKKKGGVEIVRPKEQLEKVDMAILQGDIRKAEQVLSLHGSSKASSIVALKIKNPVDGIAKENIKKALEYGYKYKAVSHSSGDYILLIFSPLVTKTANNEETAVKAALDIDNFLRDHNRKFRNNSINYGIGINYGEIISKLDRNILQFASINKTISIAKKIADLANDEVLLSKEIHDKTRTNIKADKVASGAMDVFSVKRVVDTEKAQKFISDFMRRN